MASSPQHSTYGHTKNEINSQDTNQVIIVSFSSHNATTKHNKKTFTTNSTSHTYNHNTRLEIHTSISHISYLNGHLKDLKLTNTLLTTKPTIELHPPYIHRQTTTMAHTLPWFAYMDLFGYGIILPPTSYTYHHHPPPFNIHTY